MEISTARRFFAEFFKRVGLLSFNEVVKKFANEYLSLIFLSSVSKKGAAAAFMLELVS